MTTLEVVGLIVLSYIAGSMPFGYWFGKLVNGPDYDIRDHGSNSIGATTPFGSWAGESDFRFSSLMLSRVMAPRCWE